jgi:5'-methylthioadenosine phosphorylase
MHRNREAMARARIGVLGGSGLYRMEALTDVSEVAVDTPYGPPSDVVVTGRLGGVAIAFLARHGRGHGLLPHEVPYRANIHAFKQLGVEYLVSVSAVGSLKEDIRPLDLVLPDQYLDQTRRRASTFFGEGAVAHVSMADPVCPVVSQALADAAADADLEGARLHRGGTYVCIEGPQFSTRAESQAWRAMDASVVGMTNMPEAKLAREAEIAYASLALVTDWDCWHPHQACVTAEMAIANLGLNARRAQQVVAGAARRLAAAWPASPAHRVLDYSLVTPVAAMPAATRERLGPILGRFGR